MPYCNSNDPRGDKYCSIDKGTAIVKDNVNNIRTDVRFSDYIQDVIAYVLGFLALIVVCLILWAGFSILTAGGDDDKVKSGKKIITRAIIGLVIIFLAWSITTFIVGSTENKSEGLINAPTGFLDRIGDALSVQSAYAATASDSRGFDYYRTKIESATQAISRDYEVEGKIKAANLQVLQTAVTESMDSFPDAVKDFNINLANNVLNQIALIRKYPDSEVYVERMAESLNTYLTKVKVGTITAKINATPSTGNAPLTTTLRAVEAVDPSGVTIPDANYIWWIKGPGNSRQVIGKGPSIGYRFTNEAVYTVNLEILSASRNSKGKVDVMPFKGTQEIKVLPKLANILLFINGANASNVDTFKITPNQGRAGLVIDASSSTPSSGATIMKTEWEFGNGNRTSYNGAPRLERQVFSQEGIYTIRLKITTNESPQGIIKEIQLVSQDPIASIRADKTAGFAGDDFKFNATSNLTNALLTYEWSVMESDSGKSLFTSKNQSISYKFPRMGDYVVRLKTSSAGGKEDTDNLRIQIDSKDPIANFEVKAISSEMPNTIVLDATRSFDPDSLDASRLQFNWTIDGERVELDNSSRGGALGQYTFTTRGAHTVLLDVINDQGKTTQAKKDFEVDSLLAVKLIVTPKISQLGKPVALVAESKDATVFEWEFGDGSKENSAESRVFHTYQKSGTYDVRLTVRGNADAGNSNTIVRKVYVTDADSPYAVIGVKKGSDVIEPTQGACPAGEAFVTDRTNAISITGAESVNTDGTPSDLSYMWKYQGKTSTQKEFSYKFDELGCFPVMLTVRSNKTNKTHTSTVFVKTENALPTFASLSVSADKLDADPVVVNVSLNNATDPDGVIVSYLWYYYTDSDPEPQDFRITKSSKTAFVVPRINGKYYFAVTMEDSNGAKVNSEESREERYSITLASDNINTPLIALKVSSSQVQVDEDVTFQATVKNVVGQDLTDKVEYKWDFDGDGFYDETSTAPTVKHKYATPGNFNMKVKASYRGISNTRYQQIAVRNEIVPNLEYFAIGNTFVLMNTTTGVYTKVKWTVGESTSDNRDSFVVTIPEDMEKPEVTLEVGDGTSTKTTTVSLRKDIRNAQMVKDSKDSVIVFSYPKIEGDSITVENKTAAVYLHLAENAGVSKYAIDADIKEDSDLNGDATDDADNKGTESYTSGAPFMIKSFDAKKERTVRIVLFDASGKKLGSRDVKIILAYVDDKAAEVEEAKMPTTLTDKEKTDIETLKDLIRNKAPEGQRVKLMQLLNQLQENWSDDREKTKTIIDFQMAVSELALQDSEKDAFLDILDGFLLTDSETKDDMALATSVLQKLIPTSNSKYEEIFGKDGKGGLVGEILSHPTNIEANRTIGEKILGYIKDDTEISDSDKLILKEQLRVIIYGGSKNIPADQLETSTPSGGMDIGGILKNIAVVFLWIIGIVAGAILLLFVFFKVVNRNGSLGFQDFIIERVFGKGSPSVPPTVVPKPVTPIAPVTPVVPVAPIAPAAPVDVLGTVAPAPVAMPEIRPVLTPVTPPVDPMATIETPAASVEAEIPDWLKSTTDRLTTEAPVVETPETETVAADVAPAVPEVTEAPVTPESPLASISEETVSVAVPTEPEVAPIASEPELPSWLVGSNVSDETVEAPSAEAPAEETPSEETTSENEMAAPANSEFDAPAPAEPFFEVAPPVAAPADEVPPTPASNDLPDWLKDFAPAVPAVTPAPAEPVDDIFGDAQIEQQYGFNDAAASEEAATSEAKPKAAAPKPKKPKASKPMPEIQPTANTDDLPDWLK